MKIIVLLTILSLVAANAYKIVRLQSERSHFALNAKKQGYGFGERITRPNKAKNDVSAPPQEFVATPTIFAPSMEEKTTDATFVTNNLFSTASGAKPLPLPDEEKTVQSTPIKEPPQSLQEAQAVEIVEEKKTVAVINEPTVMNEEVLKERIIEETTNKDQRLKELSTLQRKLTRSIARKSEVENALIEEIESLRESFVFEVDYENARLQQLQDLYQAFTETLLAKTVLVQSERKVLEQLQEVRNKILEKPILETMDAAITKKQSLIVIEESIVKDITACAQEINQEISATQTKLQSLQSAMLTLPPKGDVMASRGYSWGEVEALQLTLNTFVEASIQREEKIRTYAATFDILNKKKGLILGENTALPDELAARLPTATPASISSSVYQAELISPSEAPSISSEDVSLLEAIGEAAGVFFSTTKEVLSSPEADQSRKTFFSSLLSLSKIGSNLQTAWGAVSSTWEREIGNKTAAIETTDEYFTLLTRAVQQVLSSSEAKQSLAEATENGVKGLGGIVEAGGVVASSLAEELGGEEQWGRALRRVQVGLQKLLQDIGEKLTTTFQGRMDRQLPASIDRE